MEKSPHTWHVGTRGANNGKERGFGVSQTWVRILSLYSCVTLNKFLNLSEPQQNRNKSTYFTGLL